MAVLIYEHILRELDPGMIPKIDEFEGEKMDFPHLAILREDSFFKNCKKHQHQPVKEIMAAIPETIKPSDPILKALVLMFKHNVRQLPVVDNEKVIGILRLSELFIIICGHCDLANDTKSF